jgi:hypothetical protein
LTFGSRFFCSTTAPGRRFTSLRSSVSRVAVFSAANAAGSSLARSREERRPLQRQDRPPVPPTRRELASISSRIWPRPDAAVAPEFAAV